jgi:UDP-N-acetyl-2-amino-2-deoxyglucuronate dehydrogenase
MRWVRPGTHCTQFMANPTIQRRKTGEVGCRKVAATHASAWHRLLASEFVGFCHRNLDQTKAPAPHFNVRVSGDLSEMIEAEHVEILSVCTQHTVHAVLIEIAAGHGAHAIVGKPRAVDLSSCDRAIAACRAAAVKLGTISQRRFDEPVQRMKSALDSGLLGKPVLTELVTLGWRELAYYHLDHRRRTWKGVGCGVAVSQAHHYLALMSWFMGPVRELYIYWDNYNNANIVVYDTVSGYMRFESGPWPPSL